MFKVFPYDDSKKQLWNDFVVASRNATFILNRDYMDYHRARVIDASLIIVDDNGNIAALFAASAHNGEIRAHGALTYGGLILPYSSPASSVIDIFGIIIDYYRDNGFSGLIYKSIPHIYHKYPCDEDIYALFRNGASVCECNLSAAVCLRHPLKFNQNSRRNLSKAINANLTVKQSDDFVAYWQLLSSMLKSRHNTAPVHSIDEISYLHNRFPDSIKLYVAEQSGNMLAGVVLYITDKVAHCQYIASSPRGFEVGALALIFSHLIDDLSHNTDIEYFDFGTSNENHGLTLNEGLIQQKYGFGGRGVAYPSYKIDL